eukprot:15432578-Alexandrium_andersonii.AAC.1
MTPRAHLMGGRSEGRERLKADADRNGSTADRRSAAELAVSIDRGPAQKPSPARCACEARWAAKVGGRRSL